MPQKQRQYIAIDMKSFYASVECVDRGLDPLTACLVVADKSRTEKTICLAVSPALKAYGIPGRARLFEVVQRVREVNAERRHNIGRGFSGKSSDAIELAQHPDWQLDYIVAMPRMAHYIEVSSKIYSIYLKYVSSEDIHVYSIDEVFIDVTSYLRIYKMTAHELAMKMIRDVLSNTGVTATAGIGTNMYLAKVAMDIVAKHKEADKDGVRIAELDEISYRHELWEHKPLRDFWRVGKGISVKLAQYGIDTMGKIAELSLKDENFLYKLFGVNAELLIDHAWGYEPCTMEMVKAYKPETNSLSSGQVLHCAYSFEKARIVVKEMADAIALDLVSKHKVTNQIELVVGYDADNLSHGANSIGYNGEVHYDHYGRAVPKHAHGIGNLKCYTASSELIIKTFMELYDREVNPKLQIRRINVIANHVVDENKVNCNFSPTELDIFTNYDVLQARQEQRHEELEKEQRIQKARLAIKERFGNNAILKGMNFEEGATAKDRNAQIGGHKA